MDLGAELDGFADGERKPAPAADALPRVTDFGPLKGGRLIPLADLQREGFCTTPPMNYFTKEQLESVYGKLFDSISDALGGFDLLSETITKAAQEMSSFAAQFDSHEEEQ